MRAIQLTDSGAAPRLQLAETERPTPGPGELLVRVQAAGVTTTELSWYPTTHTSTGEPRHGAIPGHEFSGVIVTCGPDVTGFVPGQAIYGMNDWFAQGATAEYCLAPVASVAAKPVTLSHAEAASVPIGALTAWQGLFDRAHLQPGQRVLVHGGAGAVGLFAVQLAHLHGAQVTATTSSATLEFVRGLGAEQALDYRADDFTAMVRDVDVVFDTVGGDTRQRSQAVLKPGGTLISIAADGEVTTDPVARAAYFIVEPNQQQLVEVAARIDSGSLKTFVKAAVPLEQAAAAYAGQVTGSLPYGKTVVVVS